MRKRQLESIGIPTAEKLERITGIPPKAKGKLESAGSKDWGGTTEQLVTPSGTKLKFQEDEEAILRFVGVKDISDIMGEAEGTILYNTFFDGRRLVTLPCSYSFKKLTFVYGVWYYLWVAAMIANRNPELNSMKDFEVRRLGEEGEKVQCPEKISADRILVLNEDTIEELNYSKLNYPLRP